MKITKKRSIIMAVLLALVTLTVTFAPALAQDDADLAGDSSALCLDGLAIIAPLGAPVNTPVTMTVLQRSDATPVQGAGVWALTRENADALNQRIAAMQESGELSKADLDWESIVQVYGILLGRTDIRGKLDYAFTESGRYLLIAVKWGYVPGRTGIGIGERLRALELRAPDRAQVGEPVNITVTIKQTGTPVEGAGVWALTREQAQAFKQEIDAIQDRAQLTQEDFDWESMVSVRGIFLGRTGENGELVTAFSESGGYLLITVKRGHLPARKGIIIGNPIQFMSIRVQSMAEVGERVPVAVHDSRSGEPVQGAGVWALTREQAEAFRQEVASMKESAQLAQQEIDWESMVSIRGTFLGRTDEQGRLDTSFSIPGVYVLVSVKHGYVPGYAFVIVRMPKPDVMDGDNATFRKDGVIIEPEPNQQVEPSTVNEYDSND